MKHFFEISLKSASTLLMALSLGLSACGGGGGSGAGSNNPLEPSEIPNIRAFCEGIAAQDMSTPDVVMIEGGNCNDLGLRNTLASGGKFLMDCPAPIVLDQEIVITNDTILDLGGGTISGNHATRLFRKPPGASLWIQRGILRDGQAPDAIALGATQADWFNIGPGGLVNVQGHDNTITSGGDFTAKNVQFLGGRVGPHGLDPDSGDILDTGTGAGVYAFGMNNVTFDECVFDNNVAVNGGAMGALGSSVRFINSVVSNNRAERNGPAANPNQGNGGGFYNDDVGHSPKDGDNYLSFCSTQFANNHAEDSGGALSLFARGGTDTDIIFTLNTVQGNTADNQGGGFYFYRIPFEAIVFYNDRGDDNFIFSGNLIDTNTAERNGGGLYLQNLYGQDGYALNGIISNNTISNNTVLADGSGGDFGYGGGMFGLGIYIDLINNTVAENTSNNLEAGIILGSSGGANGARTINNIYYNNIAANAGGPGVPGPFHVGGSLNQFVGDFNASLHQGNLYFPGASDTPGGIVGDPLLQALADNGGATQTMALGAGSPAINAGVVAEGVPDVDQRDLPRDDGTPDMGAFEVQ